jgi:GLPGLI family protein
MDICSGMRYIPIVIALCLLAFTRCKLDNKSEEGIIIYDIAYQQEEAMNPIAASVMPSKMELKFRKNDYKITIEGFMGLFSLSNIYNVKSNRNITLLKFWDKKYKYVGMPGESSVLFGDRRNLHIQYCHDTKVIAGLLCHKAMVKDNTRNNKWNIFYTNQIKIKNPNQTTPYELLKGVLMDFQLTYHHLNMKLVTKQVQILPQDPSVFDIPDSYKSINRESMDRILTNLMN